MTDSEINIAIARACGWKDRPDPFYTDKLAWTHDEGATWVSTCDLPDYCHDLNAMHGVEKCVDADLAHGWRYWTTLAEILCADEQTETWQHYRVLIHATARQRAEAFISVKGLWRGEA